MKRIRTADGGLLFLEDEDYMPKLLTYLRTTAGNDAADAVEEWAREQLVDMAEALRHTADKARVAEEKARASELKALGLQDRVTNLEAVLNDERDSHIDEITELEEELVRVAEVKDHLMAANEYLTDLINHPERLFPEIGASVWREIDGKRKIGTITEVSLKKDYRTGKTEFAIIAQFWPGKGARYRLANLGKTIHLIEGPSDGG